MRVLEGEYEKPSGAKEVRWHFPEWKLSSGRVVPDVSIFPHPCGTCTGGDHTHVETHDERKPLKVLREADLEFPPEVKAAIDRYIESKLALNGETLRLVVMLAAHPHDHSAHACHR